MPNTQQTNEAGVNRQPTLEEFAHSKLLSYVAYQFNNYVIGRMHRLLAAYLEALERGDITRLMIFAPPRHGKTSLVGEYFPAWYLGRNPAHHIIYTTYNQERGNDVGRRVRDQVISENFARIFPGCTPSKDSKSVHNLSTEEHGEYFNVGIGGAITGRGANCLTGDTKIYTEIGEIPIRDLCKMDPKPKVATCNPERGIVEFRNIVASRIVSADKLVQIETLSGSTLTSTPDHRIFNAEFGYLPVNECRNLDRVYTLSRTFLENTNFVHHTMEIRSTPIAQKTYLDQPNTPVYDIQVEEPFNFFANRLLVHNCLIIDDPIKSREEAESKLVRDKIQTWYKGVAYTRVMPGGRIVIIMTRWHCFHPETLILTTNGWLPAKEIKQTHLLITDHGTEAIKKMEHQEYTGDIYKIKIYGMAKSLMATGNHKVLTANGWKYAAQLTKDDWLIVPNMLGGTIPQFEKPKKSTAAYDSKLTGAKNHIDRTELEKLLSAGKTYADCAAHFNLAGKGSIHGYIKLYGLNRKNGNVASPTLLNDPGFWRLIGYWLAEGSLSKARKHYSEDNYTIIVLTIGAHEKWIADDIKTILDPYHINVTTCLHKGKTAIKVQFSCWQIAQYLKTHFGCHAQRKRLPQWISTLSEEYKQQLLIGYFRGDGCFSDKMGYRAGSVSLELLTTMQQLLTTMNIPSTLIRGRKKGEALFKIKGELPYITHNQESYELRIHEAYIPWMNIKREKYPIRNSIPPYQIGIKIKDARLQLRVRKIEKFPYKGLIYDFETGSHAITAAGVVVHNSNDLAGYLLAEHAHENWTVLDLKAIAEPGDILGRKEGEALWPEFRDVEHLHFIRETIGPREWNAQFQQRPTAAGGGKVLYEWLKYYEAPPKAEEVQKVVASWDTAYKPEQINDPTACTVWQVTSNGYYLIDVINKRLTYPDLIKEVVRVHELHHPSMHLIEGRATGQSLIQELKLRTRIPVLEISTKNINNQIRFDAITTFFEAGKVWFPKQAHWLAEAEDQICSFPTAPHDDIADSTSQFLNWTNKPRFVPRPPSKLYWK